MGCFLEKVEQVPDQKIVGFVEHQIQDPAMMPITSERNILMVKNSMLGISRDPL